MFRRFSAAVGCVGVAVFMSVATAAAQDRPALAAAAHEPEESGKAPGDGIKVHGHWTIDVRNPDGTLASHNEFENACFNCGAVLSALISRQGTIFRWQVQLADQNASGQCTFFNQPTQCISSEPDPEFTPEAAAYFFPTLVARFIGDTCVLTGNVTTSAAGAISRVISAVVLDPLHIVRPFSSRLLSFS
jgi:hypothetical protein